MTLPLTVANLAGVVNELKDPINSITPDHIIVTNSHPRQGGPRPMKPTHKSLRKQMLTRINERVKDAYESQGKTTPSSDESRVWSWRLAALREARAIVLSAFRDYDLAKQAERAAEETLARGKATMQDLSEHVVPRAGDPITIDFCYDNAPKPDKTVIIPITTDTKPLSRVLQEAAKTIDQQVKASLKAYSDFGSQMEKIGALMNKPVTIPVDLDYRSPKPAFMAVTREQYEWAIEGQSHGYNGAPVECRTFPMSEHNRYQVSTKVIE
jgi:hypothetical protein